jgi:peptide-methionine (S)-S-oxide reductase
MSVLQNAKIAVLGILIVIGFAASHSKAHASGQEILTVAGGCFWCVEADFEGVDGVKEVVSGYTGGTVENPTYKQVTRGGTGHYEAVQITFDPKIVTRDALLAKFFRSIDPTDSGGQFCDRGESYRSAVFYSDASQQSAAEQEKARAEKALGQTVVTPLLPASRFYLAADYHQDYYKGSSLVLTRFGPKSQSSAYKAYRKACGRDERVKELWGSQAPFVNS